MSLRRGQQLGAPEEPSDHLSCVLLGALRACRPLVDGRRQVTAFLLPGDWHGLDRWEGQRTVLEAVTDARVARIHRRALGGPDGEAAGGLQRALLASLEAAHTRVAVLGQSSARDKLAAFLLAMSDRLAPGGADLHLPMSRGDIGDFLGLRSETVCRTFAHLASTGAIGMPEPQRVRLLDPAALRTMAGWS